VSNYKMYPNVKLGENVQIGDFCIIGVPPKGEKEGALETVIGDNAVISSHTVIYAGNKIGANFFAGHGVLVRECNEIGNNVSIGSHSVIEHHLKIEDNVRIHSNVFIPEYSLLKDGCLIGPNVVCTNAFHPLCPKVKECLKGPTIGENAKVGANVTLLPAVVVGKNALVGAGAVVIEDVPPEAVVVGNPAKVVKNISELKCPYEIVEKPYF